MTPDRAAQLLAERLSDLDRQHPYAVGRMLDAALRHGPAAAITAIAQVAYALERWRHCTARQRPPDTARPQTHSLQ